MFQETSYDKKNKGKSLIDSNFKIKMRDISSKFILFLAKTSNIKYKIVRQNSIKKIKDKSTIYVINHYSAQDTPIACNIIPEKGYILAGVQRLGFFDNLFFWAYGSIFVKRQSALYNKEQMLESKEDMKLSKEAMGEYLKNGKAIIMFPEGTWNLEDALLMLNMKWGVIDLALENDSQIIPINLYYDRDNMICEVTYHEPILITDSTNKKEAIKNLRDTMATMAWMQIENHSKNITKRSELNIDAEKIKNSKSIDEFPKIDIDYETSVIYNPYPKCEEVYEPIKKLELSKRNAFLFSKNNKGMW